MNRGNERYYPVEHAITPAASEKKIFSCGPSNRVQNGEASSHEVEGAENRPSNENENTSKKKNMKKNNGWEDG